MWAPQVSVIPNRFGRAPGAGRSSGGSTGARLPGPRWERSVVANAGSAARRAAWSGQPRKRVTRSRSSRARVRAGSGTASVTSVAPAMTIDSRPMQKPPVQKNGIGM